MEVNITTDVKAYGAPAVSSVEIDDGQKPQVQPVAKTTDSVSVALKDKAQQGQQKTGSELSQQDLEEVIDDMQSRMDSIGSKLNFGLHQDQQTESIVIQITDRTNGELVKQFPSEAVLKLQEKLQDLVGLLFDKQA